MESEDRRKLKRGRPGSIHHMNDIRWTQGVHREGGAQLPKQYHPFKCSTMFSGSRPYRDRNYSLWLVRNWLSSLVLICSAQSENLHNLEIAYVVHFRNPEITHYSCAISRLHNTPAWCRDCATIVRNLLPNAHVQTPSLGFKRSY